MKIYLQSLLAVTFVMLSLCFPAQAKTQHLTGFPIGFVILGHTPMAELQKRLGEDDQEIGVHPGSAREWRLPSGGCLKADRTLSDGSDSVIVDHLILSILIKSIV